MAPGRIAQSGHDPTDELDGSLRVLVAPGEHRSPQRNARCGDGQFRQADVPHHPSTIGTPPSPSQRVLPAILAAGSESHAVVSERLRQLGHSDWT